METRPGELYADIVVRQGRAVAGPFSYSVPEALRPRIALGQLVWVPFRRTRLPGIVVGLSDRAPEFDTRPLAGILEERPALTEVQVRLARWISQYYLCSLAEAAFAMLPPGVVYRVHRVAVLTDAGRSRALEGVAPATRNLIEALRAAGGEMEERELCRRLERKSVRGSLQRLATQGWLQLETRIAEPLVRPHYEPFLVLSGTEAEVMQHRAELWAGRRHSVSARILEALARAPAGERDRASLLREVKGTASALKRLEKAGLVQLEPDKYLVWAERLDALLPLRQTVPAVEPLLEAEGRLEVRERGELEPFRALSRKGLVRVEKQPARVRLTVLPEVARERAASLRRTLADERGLAILDALAASGERALPLSELGRLVPGASRSDAEALVAAGICRFEVRERYRDPLAAMVQPPEAPPVLTTRQGLVWQALYEGLSKGGYQVFLLHGVTGSGKTEIYLRALGRVLREGRQAIVLVPEIALTAQVVQRFAARFPGRIAVQHSGLSPGERYDQWRRIRDGKVDVVIGARSAIFAPLPRLGLIVVDEEHDPSYKQDDRPPRYHAREVALALARLTGSTVVLGSATPSCESYWRAQRGTFRLLELPERIRVREGPGGTRIALTETSLPRVRVVDMREELRAGNRSIFSRDLQRALREVLQAGEQAILYLNRRGTATFVMCRACGHVVRCPQCDVALVYHSDSGTLLCHRCGRRAAPPSLCPACHSATIRYFGAGTERVVAEVLAFFPNARVLRWDRDATRDLRGYQETLEAFASRNADVLVGTQMVAKGLDLPHVALVGVVSADTGLDLPDLRAAERTFQLLTQVVGRAGRRAERGLAIIQTYHPDHYAIQAAARQDYRGFFRQEIAYRQRHGYPPLRQLAVLTYAHPDEGSCRQEATRLAACLRRRAEAAGHATLIGPAPAFVPRVRGRYRWQLLLLAPRVHPLLAGLELGPGWTVDVDPANVLT